MEMGGGGQPLPRFVGPILKLLIVPLGVSYVSGAGGIEKANLVKSPPKKVCMVSFSLALVSFKPAMAAPNQLLKGFPCSTV